MSKMYCSILLAIYLFSYNVYSQNCIDLVSDHTPEEFRYNPDYIKIDTCQQSPTFGKYFADKYFYINFDDDVYLFDTILGLDQVKTVSDVKSSLVTIKAQLQQIQTTLGNFDIIRNIPGIVTYSDSIHYASSEYYIYFDNYQNIIDVINEFNNVDSVVTFKFSGRINLGAMSLPSDKALEPEYDFPYVYPPMSQNQDYSVNFKPTGFHSELYDLNCPMAWEITDEFSLLDNGVVIGIADFPNFDGVHHKEFSNFIVPLNYGNTDDGYMYYNQGTGHSQMVASQALSVANNTHNNFNLPAVGTNPASEFVMWWGAEYEYVQDGPDIFIQYPGGYHFDIDGNDLNDEKKYVDVQNMSFGILKTDDASHENSKEELKKTFEAGIIAVSGVGNKRHGLNNKPEWVARLDDSNRYRLEPAVLYPGGYVYKHPLYPNNGNYDCKVITVGGVKPGILYDANCNDYYEDQARTKVYPHFSDDLQFIDVYNFAPGIDKFSTDNDRIEKRRMLSLM